MRKKQGPPASKGAYRKDDSRKPYGKKEDTRSNYGSKDTPRGKKDSTDRPFRRNDEDGAKKEERTFGGRPKRSFGENRDERKPYDRKPRRFEDSGDRPKRSFGDNNGEKKPYERKPKRFEAGDDHKPSDRKPGFRKKFDNDEKPARGGFGKKDGRDFEKPARASNSRDKFADKKAGLKKGHKKAEEEDASKFRDQDIFEKRSRFKKKEDDENYIQNENEGFSKTVTDKYGKKPRSKKQAEHDDDDDEDDFLDPRDIKKNSARYEPVQVTAPMTLNKYIAHSGQCSRRDAAELVKKGKVRVNGELMLDPGYRVLPEDQVVLGGKKLTPQKNLIYILLNKPKGFITTTEDPEGRKTVMELVADAEANRLFPVGRLDRNTTGLLLLTNDGDLAQKLSHPKHEIKKIYQVTLDKQLSKTDFEKVLAGVELEDGVAVVDSLAYLEDKNEVGLEIHSGRNRIVRRIFEAMGYEVEKLDRVMYAGLTKKNIPRGKWRFLTDHEVVLLKHFKN